MVRGYRSNEVLGEAAQVRYRQKMDAISLRAMAYLEKLDDDHEKGKIDGREFSIAGRLFNHEEDAIGRDRRDARRAYDNELVGSAMPL